MMSNNQMLIMDGQDKRQQLTVYGQNAGLFLHRSFRSYNFNLNISIRTESFTRIQQLSLVQTPKREHLAPLLQIFGIIIYLGSTPFASQTNNFSHTQKFSAQTVIIRNGLGLHILLRGLGIEDDSHSRGAKIYRVDGEYAFELYVDGCFFFGFAEGCLSICFALFDCSSDNPPSFVSLLYTKILFLMIATDYQRISDHVNSFLRQTHKDYTMNCSLFLQEAQIIGYLWLRTPVLLSLVALFFCVQVSQMNCIYRQEQDMEGASRTESHSSSDDMNNDSIVDFSKDLGRSSLNDMSITQLDNQLLRRNLSDDAYPNVLPTFGLDPHITPYNFEPKEIVTKQHRSLLTAPEYKEHAVEFVCFGSMKVILWQTQLQEFIDKKKFQDYDTIIYCCDIIEEVIRLLCLSQYNFEPLRIRKGTFTLYVVQSTGKRSIDRQNIEILFSQKKIQVTRVERKGDGTGRLVEYKKDKKDEEVVEVLSPDEQDIVESIDRSKNIAKLKEQIASNYYQIIGEMILISYTQFKLINNSTKIADLPEKTIEIYQRVTKYIDPAFIKQPIFTQDSHTQQYEILPQKPTNTDMASLLVSESSLYGELTLSIEENELVEKYSGGLMSYLRGDRIRRLALITLGGLKVDGLTLKLSFRLKNGEEICSYIFSQEQSLRQVLTHILRITRNYNHQIEVLA